MQHTMFYKWEVYTPERSGSEYNPRYKKCVMHKLDKYKKKFRLP
jgi:hypothetical protein